MSRQFKIPTYRLHKQSGQGIVTLTDVFGSRRDVLLGQYNTPASRAEYARVIGEWELHGRRLPKLPGNSCDVTLNEVMLAYLRHAEGCYVKDGRPTDQMPRVRLSIRALCELYGHTRAVDFGPLSLKVVREQMVKQGLCRRVINQRVGCIKLAFKWAVAEELVPASVLLCNNAKLSCDCHCRCD